MKILYLYAELSPYLRPVFEAYVKTYRAELHVVHWDHLRLTPYQPPLMDGVSYYKRSEYNLAKMKKLVDEIAPDLIYVAGWMDKDYLRITRKWRARGIPIVAGFDDVWFGNFRQQLGSFVMKAIGRLFFSHAFVSFAHKITSVSECDRKLCPRVISCARSSAKL